MATRGGSWGRENWMKVVKKYKLLVIKFSYYNIKLLGTLLYLKWITNKVPLYSTGNCTIICGSLDGMGVWGRMDTCMYMAQSLCCPPEIITTLLINYNPIQNKKLKKTSSRDVMYNMDKDNIVIYYI